jgi:GTPase SAR1 family protein
LAWCKENGDIPFFETSAQNALNVDEAFRAVVKLALERDAKEDAKDSKSFQLKDVELSRKKKCC